MTRTHVVSGAASAIGAATAALLREQGHPGALGRDGRPEEVAAPIAFLPSAAASLVGSVLHVEGGTDAILHAVAPAGWEVELPAR